MFKQQFIFGIMLATWMSLANAGWLLAQDKQDKKKEAETVELKVGDKAPDFELETFADKTVKLSDRFGKKGKPVVLLFSRANW